MFDYYTLIEGSQCVAGWPGHEYPAAMRILPTDMAIRGCAAHRAVHVGPTGNPNFTLARPLAATAPTDAETSCGARLGRQQTLSELFDD
jgi:hypothetical protein